MIVAFTICSDEIHSSPVQYSVLKNNLEHQHEEFSDIRFLHSMHALRWRSLSKTILFTRFLKYNATCMVICIMVIVFWQAQKGRTPTVIRLRLESRAAFIATSNDGIWSSFPVSRLKICTNTHECCISKLVERASSVPIHEIQHASFIQKAAHIGESTSDSACFHSELHLGS